MAVKQDKKTSRFRVPVPFEPPIFDGSCPEALAFLEECGYVVLQVLTDGEVQQAECTFWAEANTAFGWVEGIPQTWKVKEKLSTMAHRSDCGHLRGWDFSKFRWELLKNKRIQAAFAAICRHFAGATGEESNELLASFNSINVFRPHQHDAAENNWRTTSVPWYHVDNPKPQPGSLRGQRVIFPGILNLEPVTAESGGFVCVPKSHKLFAGSAHEGESETYLDLEKYNNFVESEPNQRVGNKIHTQPILVCTGQQRRGTLLIWDPRLVHCSTSSLAAPDEVNARAAEPRLLRLATFVSLCPRAWSTVADRQARRQLVEQRQCINSHIPYAVVTQRRVDSAVFYEGLWEDDECLGLIGSP